MKKNILYLLLFFALAPLSFAGDSIVVVDPWVREVPPGTSVSAAYMVLENTGDKDDKLVSITSGAAESVELHSSSVDKDGVASMERIYSLNIPKGEKVELKPGGMHLMLIGLNESIIGKENIMIDLNFENSGNVQVEVPVKSIKGSGEHHNH